MYVCRPRSALPQDKAAWEGRMLGVWLLRVGKYSQRLEEAKAVPGVPGLGSWEPAAEEQRIEWGGLGLATLSRLGLGACRRSSSLSHGD